MRRWASGVRKVRNDSESLAEADIVERERFRNGSESGAEADIVSESAAMDERVDAVSSGLHVCMCVCVCVAATVAVVVGCILRISQ